MPTRPISPGEVKELLALLEGIDHAIVGGAAMMMEGLRPAKDVDVVMRCDDVPEASRRMEEAGARLEPVGNERMRGFLAEVPREGGIVEVELVCHVDERGEQAPWVDEALFGSGEGQLPRAWLLVTKLDSTREKDMEDAIALWKAMTMEERKSAKDITRRHMGWEAKENLEGIEMMAGLQSAAATARQWVRTSCRGMFPRG